MEIAPGRTTYVLVDGENIDATLGSSILNRKPLPEERPRWDRVLKFAEQRWGQPVRGLFFLAANAELPMSFIQALLALGYTPIPLSGTVGDKVVDIAIQRTLVEIRSRPGDVMLVSHDGDFLPQVQDICDGRRVGLLAFREFRNSGFLALEEQGLEFFDLEYDVAAFRTPLNRIRIIPIDEFVAADFL